MAQSSRSISRRGFLKGMLAGGVAATLPLPALASDSPKTAASTQGAARNLIFLVSDGMDHGTLAAANHYLNLAEDRDSEWMRLYRDGVARRSLAETRSASSIVTDSAAASSAWGCGRRLDNRSVNTTAAGEPLTPLYTYARRAGLRTGLVTTARVTHATPAGFAANVPHRDFEDEIARQYLERRVDVMLGGGSKHFDPARRTDKADLHDAFSQAGYSVLRERSQLVGLPGAFRPVLGTFAKSHMPYSLDLSNDDDLRASTPTLSEMMTKALALLGDGDARFVLQVEAGRVDHGAHGNDPAATLFDQLEFDRCIAIARAFAERRGDTLVIITTDHGTGGFMLNGYGVEYSQSSDCFKNLRLARASFEYILDVLGENPEPTMVADALRRGLALELTPAQLEHVMQAFRPSVGAAPVDFLGVDINLGLVLRPILLNFYAVSWTTQNHTADHAELASFGPGSEAIPTWLENWELHQHLRNALAI